ncbi:MAG: hypothetical protein KDA63_14900, partial [Planctomycetales bacterium]|nr:hypothetical protein [Planctomycetales bacterium]
MLCLAVVLVGMRAARGQALRDVEPVTSSREPIAADDADLADVCFVDEMNGWAVGDHGAVWRTTNAGRTWRLQPTPIDCRLNTVWFVDGRTGWAAGGRHDPLTGESHAVLLRSDDGGWHWSYDAKLDLPAIHAMRFLSGRRGIAVGESSPLHPSGVWMTADGGRNWTPQSTAAPAGWRAMSLADMSSGLLVGPDGTVARWTGAGLEQIATPEFDGRRVTAAAFGEKLSWLAGEGGTLVRVTDEVSGPNAAHAAQPIDLPSGARGIDFSAAASVGKQVWVAGRPGTVIYHSVDDGATWEAQLTGQPLPINDLCFVDANHGWAVGAMGTILATDNGGQTWHQQRGEGRRGAWMALFSRPEDVPLEWVTELGAEKGYRGVVEVVNRRYGLPTAPGTDGLLVMSDPRVNDDVADLHEATVLAGGCSAELAWGFPLPASGLRLAPERIAPVWSQLNDGTSLAALERWMIRTIRIWRPDVILTHEATHQASSHLEQTISGLVLTAVDKAGRSQPQGGGSDDDDLPPWKVTKVFGVAPDGEGSCSMTPWRLSPTLGISPASLAMRAQGVLSPELAVPPDRLALNLHVNNLSHGVGERDVFAGIHLVAGGPARRPEAQLHTDDVQGLRVVARKHRNITALLTRFATDDARTSGALGEVGRLTDELDDEA